MVNNIIAGSFETLGGGAQKAVGQVKQAIKQLGDDVAENIGIKPTEPMGTNEQGGQQQQVKPDDQMKKAEAKQKSLVRKKYQQIQEEIKQIQQKRSQEMQKYHLPGNTDEEKQKNQIKQLEEKPPSVPPSGTSAGKGNLPPIPVQQSAHKTERFRGSSG